MTDTPSLTAALAAVQADLPSIAKGETAEVEGKSKTGVPYKYKYSYADLADVSQVILPLLGKNGLAWITKPTYVGDRFVLAYKLRHVSGEEEAGEYPLPDRGTPQEIGSAITYARRYALCAVTGVAPASDDDDGAAATHRAQREQFEDARPRPDPEAARLNILANAEAAIDASPAGNLRAIQDRIGKYVSDGAITPVDQAALLARLAVRQKQLDANREASLPAEDRTAEPTEPAEQQPMDTDWPEPVKPGQGDPA